MKASILNLKLYYYVCLLVAMICPDHMHYDIEKATRLVLRYQAHGKEINADSIVDMINQTVAILQKQHDRMQNKRYDWAETYPMFEIRTRYSEYDNTWYIDTLMNDDHSIEDRTPFCRDSAVFKKAFKKALERLHEDAD